MESKFIKCPKCGSVLQVKNSANLAVKTFACPACKSILQVKFRTQAPAGPQHTTTTFQNTPSGISPSAATYPVRGGETQIQSGVSHNSQTVALYAGGHRYPLALGENTIGRKAASSKATVQIACNDHYMSRCHSFIDVSILPNGCTKAVISNASNKNATCVNGQQLEAGDKIILRSGDEIRMGETILKVIIK
jgi:phage FluMu protein Com